MIPVCEPTLIGKEKEYVDDCLKTNWISSNGKYLELFEKRFSSFCNTNFGVSCCNGTAAIHLAVEALGIGKGDEVIVPTFTMAASSNAVIYSGARPAFVDCERDTFNIDPEKIEEKITKKTKAIMPVHIYGHPCDMDRIKEIADRHDLFIIEDAAEAHGAEYKGRRIGSLSDVAAFSFYSNKIITTGEGGMVVTNDEKIAEKAKLLRNHAFIKPRFLHKELGYNYRMTNIQAAIGTAQMEYADKLVQARIKNALRYNSLLKDVGGLTLPIQKPYAKNVYWMYSLVVEDNFGMDRDRLVIELEKKGIETRNFFLPMHSQPLYRERTDLAVTTGDFPVSEELSKKGFYLPSSSSLTEEQRKCITDAIIELHD